MNSALPPATLSPNTKFGVSYWHVAPEEPYAFSENNQIGNPTTVFYDFRRHCAVSAAERDTLRRLIEASPDTFGVLHSFTTPDGDPDPSMMLFPRNLEWKSLPMTGRASVAHAFTEQHVAEADFDGYLGQSEKDIVKRLRAQDDATVSSATQIVVPASIKGTTRLRKLLAVWDCRPDDFQPALWFFDGDTLVPAPEGYVSEQRARYRVEEHFLWNWRLNWTLLCSRALAKVCSETADLRDAYEVLAPSLDKGTARSPRLWP